MSILRRNSRYRICVSIGKRSLNDVLEGVKLAESKGADLIEIRFDYLLQKSPETLDKIRTSTKLPLIFTLRSNSYGGLFTGSEKERLKIFEEAARKGFNYIDVEYNSPLVENMIELRDLHKSFEIIISWHDFNATPQLGQLVDIHLDMCSQGCDVSKIVTTARRGFDNLIVLGLFKYVRKPTVAFAMGDIGIPSRVLSPLFGGFYTYASLEVGSETAPGQISIDAIRSFLGAGDVK
ncbi:type I 3-dehydroquinate dehydratase [Candidatus Bathyarchaeota archaeon ex4484_205]|nr:MAG: type I 3-dehydroquinate dehydratase [Candidatus Bathyarchaeota archaeon ex4484_205]HDN18388.1 type I 3-dehydroquinate dehydratase [Candidatus Bathyarchaeota archaeon]